MNEQSLWSVFVNAALVNNFVLAWFLGLCPFMGVSARLATATRMGAAVSVVMVVASVSAYVLHHLLIVVGAPFLELIAFIVVIASTVQLLELLIRKVSPGLFQALGIFLPLISTNCAILGVALFQTNRGYGFAQCVVFALGAGTGFVLALVLMAGVRERLALGAVPDVAQGTAIALIVGGILSLAFMGFAGLGA